MQDFCSRSTQKKLNVYAVDLPANQYEVLQGFLDTMQANNKLAKPVSLVTPSASGVTMVGWAKALPENDSQQLVSQYIRQWIPVAAHSVLGAPDEDIRKLNGLPVLAIYGDEDTQGHKCSHKLKDLVDAQVMELRGRHPCYFDSPNEFVTAVVQFVDA